MTASAAGDGTVPSAVGVTVASRHTRGNVDPAATATVTPMPLRHSLPLITELSPGESVDSWIEAMASRYETTTGVILDAIGIRPPSSMPAVLLGYPHRSYGGLPD